MGEGQSELFVPRPERRLVVPAESCAWWGVDGSTQRVAIGTIMGSGRRGVFVGQGHGRAARFVRREFVDGEA